MTRKMSATALEWSAIGKNTLSSVDSTRRFLWAGAEPNFYAGTLLFPFCAAFGFALNARRGWSIAWLSIVILCAIGILGTYSRSAFLVSSFVLMPIIFGKKQKTLLGIVLLGVVFASIATWIPSSRERILSIGDNIRYTAGSGRAESAVAGLELYPNAPLGAGLGATVDYLRRRNYSGTNSSHNTYIQTLLDIGPQGLFCLIALVWVGLKGMMRSTKLAGGGKNRELRVVLSALLWGAIATALFAATIPANDLKFLFLISVLGYSLNRQFALEGSLLMPRSCEVLTWRR